MWEKILPARMFAKNKNRSQISPSKIVADLDAIKAEPVLFVLHGKEFLIVPMDVVTFMSMLDEYMNLMDLKKLDSVTPEQLVENYFKCFSKVIPDLTKKDISDMTQQQCAALYELVMDTITGRVFTEKKSLYHKMEERTQTPQGN